MSTFAGLKSTLLAYPKAVASTVAGIMLWKPPPGKKALRALAVNLEAENTLLAETPA